MDLRIVVKGPSEREFRREVERAALREARRQYPGTEVAIDRQSLNQATRDMHKSIRDLIRKFK